MKNNPYHRRVIVDERTALLYGNGQWHEDLSEVEHFALIGEVWQVMNQIEETDNYEDFLITFRIHSMTDDSGRMFYYGHYFNDAEWKQTVLFFDPRTGKRLGKLVINGKNDPIERLKGHLRRANELTEAVLAQMVPDCPSCGKPILPNAKNYHKDGACDLDLMQNDC